jgi:hypothetical protein
MSAIIRTFLSGLVAFLFYAAWAYFANSLVTHDHDVLVKAALVQGIYSGAITLVFTVFLEFFFKIFSHKTFCLPFIVPYISSSFRKSKNGEDDCVASRAIEESLIELEAACKGHCLPGMLVTPLPAIALQSALVIGVNIIFETPNLWLTVAPSIFFSAVYGYAYSIGLGKKRKK